MSIVTHDVRPGLRERNKADRRERIRRAARALFRRHGFAGTTTRAIAERADIGTGTLFLYARSKEEVLLLVFAEDIERIGAERLASLPTGAPVLDQLLHVFDGFFAFFARDPELARLFVKELLFVDARATAASMRLLLDFIGRLGGLVSAAQAQGEIDRAAPALLIASNVWAVYLAALIARLNGTFPDEAAFKLFFRASLELVLRGVRAARGGKP